MASTQPLVDLDSLTEAVPEDRLYDALADAKRRYVLTVCYGEVEPLDLDVLAERLADRTVEDRPDRDSDAVRERVRLGLYHLHLPKLADANLIEFDSADGTVAPAHDDPAIVSELATLKPDL